LVFICAFVHERCFDQRLAEYQRYRTCLSTSPIHGLTFHNSRFVCDIQPTALRIAAIVDS
jgi:hypothetical protein